MLKKEQLDALAKLTGIDNLAAAITDEKEVEITVPEGAVYSDDNLNTLKANEYKRGQTAGVEIAVKDFKQKTGLDFQGKTIDGLAKAIEEKTLADAKIEPEKKVKELQDKLATVQATATELQTKLADKDKEVASVKLHTELVKHVPAGTLLEPDEVVTLMKAKGYEFKAEDGKVVAYLNGHPVQDKLANATPVADVIKGFATEKKLIATKAEPPGGRGGKSDPPGGKGGTYAKASEIKAEFEAAGKSLQGQEFMDAVQKARAANKEFEIDI